MILLKKLLYTKIATCVIESRFHNKLLDTCVASTIVNSLALIWHYSDALDPGAT